jgi:hypothetical protein
MKLMIPANIPARTPIERKSESEIAEINLKDQKMTKTISAARIDTAADIIIRNRLFEFPLFLV